MIFIRVILVVGFLTAMIAFAYFHFRDTRVCARGYDEEYMIAGWTEFRMIGNVMVPTFHPPRQSTRFVCEKWEEEWQKP